MNKIIIGTGAIIALAVSAYAVKEPKEQERFDTNEYKYYGLTGGDREIKEGIITACRIISPHTLSRAKILLADTVAVETYNGKAKDYSPKYGEGLTQFDKGTFLSIRDKYKNSSTQKRFLEELGIDIGTIEYEDLRKVPLFSIIYARLLYYSFSEPLPTTTEGRWKYYKKYFNSSLGATTREKYYNAIKISVFA